MAAILGEISVLSSILMLVHGGELPQFDKLVSLNDPDVNKLFIENPELTYEKKWQSVMGCAALASKHFRSNSTSAFKLTNNSCILGRSPIFLDWIKDKTEVGVNDDGIYVLRNKPIFSEESPDVDLYYIFNEEKDFSYLYRHPEYEHSITFEEPVFVLDSPVKTLEGSKSMQLVDYGNQKGLYFNIQPRTLVRFSFMMWYHSGLSLPFPNNEGFIWLDNKYYHYMLFFIQKNTQNLMVALNYFPHTFPVLAECNEKQIPLNDWTYIGMVHDGNVDDQDDMISVECFIDGFSAGKTTFNINSTVTGQFFNIVELIMGLNFQKDQAKGHFASFEYFDRALSAAEVAEMKVKSTTRGMKKP